MNLRAIRWLLGNLALLIALALLAPAAVSSYAGEGEVVRGFLVAALVAAGLGVVLMVGARGSLRTPEGRPTFFLREGLAVVALAWLLAGVVGATPFLLAGATDSWNKALFESVSGFTTTGATIFTAEEVDRLPMGVAFWRALTHWVGGIGIVVLFVALLPTGGRSLFRSEAREAEGARVHDAALALVRIYVGLTGAHVIALWLAGVGLFDSITHAFSTMATGGFSNHGASVAFFGSPLVEGIVIVFMILAGTNFAFWRELLSHGPRRGFERIRRSTELRLYLGLLAGGSLFLTLVLWFWGGSNGAEGVDLPDYSSFLLCLRHATFNLVSIQTCTGYATADFDRWPDTCRFLLMTLAFVGGCAGSTAGGIKVVRLAVIARASIAAVRSFARPRAVVRVSLDGENLDDSSVSSVARYVILWILAAICGSLALTVCGVGLTEAVTSVVSCLNNVGPGLGAVGPAGDYGHLSGAARLVLCVVMIAGRLEFYALIALFLPDLWRR